MGESASSKSWTRCDTIHGERNLPSFGERCLDEAEFRQIPNAHSKAFFFSYVHVGWGLDDDSSFVRPLGSIDVQRRSKPVGPRTHTLARVARAKVSCHSGIALNRNLLWTDRPA